MPILEANQLTVDFADSGTGPPVVLIHSSVSGNRQWRSLTSELRSTNRVLAVNLLGYGATSPYVRNRPQTLGDQVALLDAVCAQMDGPVHMVGHSFGGAVALEAARHLGDRVSRLVLLEPNPFRMLDTAGRRAAGHNRDAPGKFS